MTGIGGVFLRSADPARLGRWYAEYLGVIDYIRKPFAMERLLEAVNKAFSSAKPEAEEEAGGETDAE